MHALFLAVACSAALAVVVPACANEVPPEQRDVWTFSAQGPFGFTSGGAPGSFYFLSTPRSAFSAGNGTRGFADYSMARGLAIGRELGLGNVQATFGVRVSEPLMTNGFTPALEDRRYLGAGPRVGLQGSNPVKSSWAVEWQVGAAMLYGNGAPGAGDSSAAQVLPSYTSNSSVLNVDGLLGLSYWFSEASKLTVGYRADYLKGTPSVGAFGLTSSTSTVDHGPVIRFSIRK
jgi:hypothetical protein